MRDVCETPEQSPNARLTDCWSRIGVRGDRSCPELAEHVHCRNCPVYAGAAGALLDGDAAVADARAWAEYFARPRQRAARASASLLLFRVGPEWLALRTAAVCEVAEPRPIHSLPHRKSPVVLGLANVRGELLVCASLAHLLGIGAAAAPLEPAGRRRVYPRLLVLRGEGGRIAVPVDEVEGVERVEERDVQAVPTSVAKARAAYTQGVFERGERSIGRLDEGLLLYALGRSLA